jgi:hypothetical protein
MAVQSAARQAADRCGGSFVTAVNEGLGLPRFWPAVPCGQAAAQSRHADEVRCLQPLVNAALPIAQQHCILTQPHM